MIFKKYKGYFYLLIGGIIFAVLLIYNQNNRNTNFDSTGIYISGSSNSKSIPNKKREDVSLPGVLRWISPFGDK